MAPSYRGVPLFSHACQRRLSSHVAIRMSHEGKQLEREKGDGKLMRKLHKVCRDVLEG